MKKLLFAFFAVIAVFVAGAQTSWKGTVSVSWSNSANWTNGIPSSTKAAVIGDDNYTGPYAPTVTGKSSCAGLTLGGNLAATLTLNRSLNISGPVLINGNGHLKQGKATLTVSGNWTNNGTYSYTAPQAATILSGTAQVFSGTGTNTFRKVTINASAVITANAPFSGVNSFNLNGTLVPAAGVTIPGAITVGSTGVLKVTAATLAANYSGTVSLSGGSTVEYNSTSAQTISSSLTYSTLRLTGSGTRSLAANLPGLNSGTGYGNIYVDGGTLDLKTFTANRSATGGGTFSLANGTTLLVTGASNFPANFTTYALGYTSTVNYNGTAQTVSTRTYGNLTLSGSGTKTLPSTAFTVANAFTTTGTVTANAAADMTVSNGSTIGAGTIVNGSTFNLTLGGGLINNGTINGNTGTLTLSGAGSTVSSSTGTGIFNLNNLTVVASGISINNTVSTVTVAGNLATTGSGVFSYPAGTINMTGNAKTITGTGITLHNLTIAGTGNVITSSALALTGNLAVSGAFSAGSILTMSGSGKTLSGSGTITFTGLSITGSVATAASFTVTNSLDVTGSLTASAGTVTFNGTCLYNGTANLFNVSVGGTSLQLAANSTLGIAGTLGISSTFNASTTTPNTVVYNGSGAQNITGTTYDNLTISNGGTKTAASGVTVLTDLSIVASTTFAASSFTHSVRGNWINNGAFTAGSSTVQLTGVNDATLTGATTFNILTVNKTAATNSVFLANNMTASVLNMTNGVLRTAANKITVPVSNSDLVNTGKINFSATATILGTIERTHPTGFAALTDYAFESANNLLTFTTAMGVTNVTMTVTTGSVASFPFGAAINRNYTIAIPSGSYTMARLRLHYEDVELNGNSEASLQLYRLNGTWISAGASGTSSTANWAEQTGLSTITGSWTLSAAANVVNWNGSQSQDWHNPANWTLGLGTPSFPPSANDIVQIGAIPFTHQPHISTAANAKSILFTGTQAATLYLDAGSLTTQGNISGSWTSNVTHSIEVGAQTLDVKGNILLSDGTSGRAINLNIGSGLVSLTGSLTQSGGASIVFSGAGNLRIGGDFTYSSGTFTAGSGTVTYNGGNFQSVGGVTYNQLVIDKTAGTATTNPLATTTVNGNLLVTAGTFDFSGPTTIVGDVTVASGASATNRTSIQVGGNWNNNGTYFPNGGVATFNGTGNQSISPTSFNKIIINKVSGTAQLTGNLTLNSDLLVTAGTLDLKTFNANRNTNGGTLEVANGATLIVGGTSNFPANYTYYTFGAASNTRYNGTGVQSVAGVSYGNLVIENGGANAKTLAAPATVQGNLTIASGATLNGSAHNLSLYGNWTNNGTFTPATGAVLAMGSGKTITGNSTFNKLTVYGSYTVGGSDLTFNDQLTIVSGGSFDAGAGTAILYGNLVNSGSLTSSGSTTFAGTQAQTVQLINAINSTSTGIINFNGTVAPVLNSTSTPTFATLNINNSSGVTPSVNWTVLVAFNVAANATFNSGTSTHSIAGNFTNNGIVTGAGTMLFTPQAARTAYLGANTATNYFNSTGTVNFSGSGALSVTGTPGALTHVVIGNRTGVSPAANWSSISGVFTIADTAVFNAGSHTYTLNGDMESNGTLNGGTSTFIFRSATAQLSGSSNTTFYDLLVNTGAALTVNSEFNVSHDLTMNGTVDATLAGPTFTGSVNGNLTGSATTLTLATFGVEKGSGNTHTLQKNVAGVTDLNITSGTLDIGTLALSQDATAGASNTLTIDNYARLRIGGTSALPSFTQHVLDSFSIVEYNGAAQALTPAITYGSIEVTAGTKTTSAALTVLKHFTITGGTFTGGNFTHSIGGNFTQTSPGVFTASGTTLHFNGVQAQVLSAASTLHHVTLNNALGLSLGSAVNVGGNLLLTNGKVTLGNHNLTVSSGNYTVSNTHYVVATGSGALVLPIATGAGRTFPVGTATSYLPATVSLDAGSAPDNISVRLLQNAQLNGSTGGALSNYAVNATWMIEEATAGNLNASVTVQWPGSRELPLFARNNCRLAHYTGGAWDYGTTALQAAGSDPYTVTRSGFTSFSPFSVRMFNAVLPVTWLSFTGKRTAGTDRLEWRTATEANSSHFEIEESSDGNSFRSIGRVAAAGFSSSVQSYFYERSSATGTRYYRLRQVDGDGRFMYSSVVRLGDAGMALQFSLSANPVRSGATLRISTGSARKLQLLLHDAGGRLQWRTDIAAASGSQTIALPFEGKAAGVYFLTLISADGTRETLRVVKE
ncbi:hypothetical protein [Flaviaesturariibacter amylovorans]|uniref:T9SS type A sorting domain-containing protein n=1 Tax=Flaviaesturariibacter amylovorans TaxID=1084520 RepID=A0ABP8GDE4_9BACT